MIVAMLDALLWTYIGGIIGCFLGTFPMTQGMNKTWNKQLKLWKRRFYLWPWVLYDMNKTMQKMRSAAVEEEEK